MAKLPQHRLVPSADLDDYKILTVHVVETASGLVLQTDDHRPFTITGQALSALRPGEHLLAGRWRDQNHFDAILCSPPLPTSPEGIETLLRMGVIKGIGPKLATKLVQVFQARTFDVLDRSPQEIATVPGMGARSAHNLAEAWKASSRSHIVTLGLLLAAGCGPALAEKLWQQHGETAVIRLLQNPYRLVDEHHGVGFKTADTIARALGFPPTHQERLKAGLAYVLMEAAGREGHTALPRSILLDQAHALLQVDVDLLAHALTSAPRLHPSLTNDQPAIALDTYYRAEQRIAEALRQRMTAGPPVHLPSLPQIPELQMLDPTQLAAVKTALTSPLSIITGGPGTGKTATIGALIATCQTLKWDFALVAPTGRAAKRIQELTNHPASTIHRWLKLRPGVAPTPPPAVQLLVVDEASMNPITVAAPLLSLVSPHTRIVLVGDPDQLPAVEPGAFLRDLLNQQQWDVTRLTTLYRQGANSLIIENAHAIRTGRMPKLVPWSSTDSADCRFLAAAQPAEIITNLVRLLRVDLPARGYTRRQVMLLTPMRKGPLGTSALNATLQHAFNPQGRPIVGAPGLRIGDPVLHTRNNLDLDRYNGDLGVIVRDHPLVVDYPDGPTEYNDPSNLQLAYAMTVHKAQGSEAPVMLFIAHPSHYILLTRQLLYTALTRAQKLAVLIGQPKALAIAKSKALADQRCTALPMHLSAALTSTPSPRPLHAPPLPHVGVS